MADIVERLRRYKRDRSGYAEYCHQAADEITRLRAERDQLRKYLDAAQRRGEELRAQVAGLEMDAERYRWLRDNANVMTPHIATPDGWKHYRSGADEVVDAALAARKAAP